MTDNSDYKLPRTKLHKLLPEPLNSDVNTAVFENTFNRFLTKPETVRVSGYVGDGNKDALISRQINEPTIDRQSSQLQPVLHTRIGTIDHIKTWKDILHELERSGIDTERFAEWGQAEVFNWVPPVDLDKLVNYGDYFWIGKTTPEYITIRNNAAAIRAQIKLYERLIDTNKSRFPIIGINPAPPGSPDTYNTIIVSGNFTKVFEPNLKCRVTNSSNTDLRNTDVLVESSSYDSKLNQTSVVLQTFFSTPRASGQLSILETLLDLKTKLANLPPQSVIASADQWSSVNMWVHRTFVENFALATQADVPILEFDPDLELNEWTLTTHKWLYRSNLSNTFDAVVSTPLLIELSPLSFDNIGNGSIVLDSVHGDQTSTFAPNTVFETSTGDIVEVKSSEYRRSANTSRPFATVIVTDTPLAESGELIPVVTSTGDVWQGYDHHWVYAGSDKTTPTNHQTVNPFITSPSSGVVTVNGEYTYRATPFAQTYTTLDSVDTFVLTNQRISGWPTSVRERALVDTDNIRVYVDNIRMFGTYVEQTLDQLNIGNDTQYVAGIVFDNAIPANTIVRIEVGEASFDDIGLSSIRVRMSTNDDDVTTDVVCLTPHRKVEQLKTSINQYPIFDVYNVDGTTARVANMLFGYNTSSSQPIEVNTKQRIDIDPSGRVFTFKQHMLDQSGGLLAYRNYSNHTGSYWVDTNNQLVYFWHDNHWSLLQFQGSEYGKAFVSNNPPSNPQQEAIWYDTFNKVLKRYISATWTELSDVVYSSEDPSLQTIWRKGTSTYIPSKVDWKGRTIDQYNAELAAFIQEDDRADSHARWLQQQSCDHSPSGRWVGEWKIPDPMYYNANHQNNEVVSSAQLLTHITSIKQQQQYQPAIGTYWHATDYKDIDFGVGGTIHEYNNGFDTLLSSAFVNNVTPATLFEFAHDQYEAQLNSVQESFRFALFALLTDIDNIVNFNTNVISTIINTLDQNDNYNTLYGDSGTFVDNDGIDIGQRNWIATLPFFGLASAHEPSIAYDAALGINEIVHHDGHRGAYALTPSTIDGVVQRLLVAIDSRSNTQFGYQASSTPAPDVDTFAQYFGTPITNRHGAFWYDNSTKSLYRLVLASAGIETPPLTHPDGTLWFDTNDNMLKIKQQFEWLLVDNIATGQLHNGSSFEDATINAWQLIDVNSVLAELILAIETRLYQAVPSNKQPAFDYDTLQDTALKKIQYDELLRLQFFNHTKQSELQTPLRNSTYSKQDPFTWNYKRSAPGVRYNILYADPVSDSFVIEGDHLLKFDTSVTSVSVFVKNSQNSGTWTIDSAKVNFDGNTELSVTGALAFSLSGILYVGSAALPSTNNDGSESASDWRGLYQQLYGTPYPHLEPWKLQGYDVQPDWWLSKYAHSGSERRWKYNPTRNTGMWTEIALGRVPRGELLPDQQTVSSGVVGEVAQYTFFSVDLDTDQLLPPYYNANTNDRSRSVFTNINQIVAPAADYAFGDQGPSEMDWRLSSQFLYDQMIIAYMIEPMKTVSQTYGFDTISVGGLVVDKRTNNTVAHNRTVFHGDITQDGTIYRSMGINQWYVNYNRYQGFDSTVSDFRNLWVNWSPTLTYQLSAFIDTDSLSLTHRSLPISKFDYNVVSKKSPGVEDFWIHGFKVTTLVVPHKVTAFNNENEWVFQLDINSPRAQSIEYYDVQKYQFQADPTTNVCTLYTYDIVSIDVFNESISLAGNQTNTFTSGTRITVSQSSNNNGNYAIVDSVYDSTTNTTIISVDKQLQSVIADGTVTTNYRTLPWTTGDSVWLTADHTVPAPLLDTQAQIGLIEYFIIVVSDTTFMIANTRQSAIDNIPIEIQSKGVGNSYVAQLHNTFQAQDGSVTSKIWRHHKLDITNKKSITPPTIIRGMQQLIDIVDGYAAALEESGVIMNNTTVNDPLTNRPVNWQVELERFINDTYALQNGRDRDIGNRFSAAVDVASNTWTWTAQQPQLNTGDPVSIMTTGATPSPLLPSVRYFIIVDSRSTFRLANTRLEANNGQAIDIITAAPDAELTIYKASEAINALPVQEINPFRNAIFFNPPRGIVSNMVTGPSEDIRNTQLLFDQYGRPLDRTHTRILREDQQTYIQCIDGVENTVEPAFITPDPYNFIHIGGAHLFVDAYEHVVMFNDRTTAGTLIYDSFIGLNVTKFELEFHRQTELTQRPSVGGSYFTNISGTDSNFVDNFEAAIENIRYMYDTTKSVEAKPITVQARTTLGYDGSQGYLDKLNLPAKSQFQFWRGMIQNKGSRQSIDAFINNRRFIDAQVDEFWAYKVAEYGSNYDQEFPELYVNTDDVRSNDFNIEFTQPAPPGSPGFGVGGFSDLGVGYDITSTQPSINASNDTKISLSDTSRWVNQPDVLQQLSNEGTTLYFDLAVIGKLQIVENNAVVRHNFGCDLEVITVEAPQQTVNINATDNQTTVSVPLYIPNADHIKIFKNGSELLFDDYQQPVPPTSSIFVDHFVLFEPLQNDDRITVVYGTATLERGVHFDRINANVLRLRTVEVFNINADITLWGYNVDYASQNPALLVDKQSSTIVSPIQLWDPARDHHYQHANNIIDIKSSTDPAMYSNTSNQSNDIQTNGNPWNKPEVGTVWMDTSVLAYVPYYDHSLFKTQQDRRENWGRLADWAEVSLYEWVESDVEPLEYNDRALIEEGNNDIVEHRQKSGRVRETLFELIDNQWIPLNDRHQLATVLDDAALGNNTYTFTLDDQQLGLIPGSVDEEIGVYVNEIYQTPPDGVSFVVPQDRKITLDDLSPGDSVRFIKYVPNKSTIDDGIDAGFYRREFEHTQQPYVDKYGQQRTKYYFWVENKITKNLNQSISLRSAEQQLTTIPIPYMITTNENTAETLRIGEQDIVKSWQYVVGIDDTFQTSFTSQILNQTQRNFDGAGDNGTFVGGQSLPDTAYKVGYIITLSNNVRITVDDVNAVGDVTGFTLLLDVQSTNTSTGTYGQTSVTDKFGNPVNSVGFTLANGINNINSDTHIITLGTRIKNNGKKATLVVGSTENDFVDSFVGGNEQDINTATYTVGDIITLSNNGTVEVTQIDSLGDVEKFVVLTSGDSFAPTSTLTQKFVNPIGNNSGFAINTNYTNVLIDIDDSIVDIVIDGRSLQSDNNEFTIDDDGRLLTIHQSVGVVANTTVAMKYTTIVPRLRVRLPNRHTNVTIRGLRRYVTQNRRFVVRFTRDFTLRDQLTVGLNQNHEEWSLIRQQQPTRIVRALWDRITESIVGHKLSNSDIAVPSLNRQLYDIQYQTDTQYGLGDQQTFTDGSLAVSTITDVLFSDTIDVGSTDIDLFMSTRNFDTKDSTVTLMSDIYSQLPVSVVNTIFFAVLHDAFSLKNNHPDIFKTSMIAVHGIRPFISRNALFDD